MAPRAKGNRGVPCFRRPLCCFGLDSQLGKTDRWQCAHAPFVRRCTDEHVDALQAYTKKLEVTNQKLEKVIRVLQEEVVEERRKRLWAEGEAIEAKARSQMARGRPLPRGYLGPGA